MVTPLVVGPMAALLLVLERLRPEREDCVPLDQPLLTEFLHFLFSFEFGYTLALIGSAALEYTARWGFPALWPTSAPTLVQLLLALFLYELTSYWQHRFFHTIPRLWRFHALHHSGARLNMLRVSRFHFVDLGSAAFVAYIPLALLGTPPWVVTLMAVVLGALGMSQHSNLRVRSPRWMDLVICTPSVHRWHHSSVAEESNRNFGNTFMLFDQLFGTYLRPPAPGPAELGIEDDPVPRGFVAQWLSPFRRAP